MAFQNPIIYDIATIFNNIKPNISQLYSEMQAANINILGIEDNDTYIKCTYIGDINNQLAVDTVIADHVADFTPPLTKQTLLSFDKKTINTNSYSILLKFVFNGSTTAKFNFNSYMDNNTTSYSIKIYDKTNNLTIGEETFTNTNNLNIVQMGPYTNLSNNKSIIEIHAKKVGSSGKNAYIETLTIDYM